ncbi:MAG TPA: translation initiation factor IF-2 associated domain-containing protein, partial [Plasticicumulans sp.]|nr:translation initiation factor IF-2 associated domain-containing protein [Plasticicumulans sp.]
MTEVTVKQFAAVVGTPVDRLLEQFAEAGIQVGGADSSITDQQKMELLAHLRKSHGRKESLAVAEPKKITLQRKTHSEIKVAAAPGQTKTVSVEVRKKRTYVKREPLPGETVPVTETAPAEEFADDAAAIAETFAAEAPASTEAYTEAVPEPVAETGSSTARATPARPTVQRAAPVERRPVAPSTSVLARPRADQNRARANESLELPRVDNTRPKVVGVVSKKQVARDDAAAAAAAAP